MERVEVNSERWFSTDNLNGEIWKDIPGYEGVYQVSNYSRIKALARTVTYLRKKNFRTDHIYEHILRFSYDRYLVVGLKKQGEPQKHCLVHRIVANAFILNPKGLPYINHKDGNKYNCSIDNLEWCTNQENKTHAMLNDLVAFGENHGRAKLTEKDVIDILHQLSIGRSCRELSEEYGVHISTISLINTGKNWRRTSKK